MDPKQFFEALKRSNVYKVAVAYAVVAWLLVQVATQVFPFFEVPAWALSVSSVVVSERFFNFLPNFAPQFPEKDGEEARDQCRTDAGHMALVLSF